MKRKKELRKDEVINDGMKRPVLMQAAVSIEEKVKDAEFRLETEHIKNSS